MASDRPGVASDELEHRREELDGHLRRGKLSYSMCSSCMGQKRPVMSKAIRGRGLQAVKYTIQGTALWFYMCKIVSVHNIHKLLISTAIMSNKQTNKHKQIKPLS